MLKHWQSHRQYLDALQRYKTRLDSSGRIRWRSLKPIRERLKSLNLDTAGAFLSRLYPPIGRPALNQAQVIRSFVLFFLLYREGLVPLSITKWVDIIKEDELYSTLIGCPLGSSPPLGSYYDFMDRLWAAPQSDRYKRNKTFPSNKISLNPKSPKVKEKKLLKANPALPSALVIA